MTQTDTQPEARHGAETVQPKPMPEHEYRARRVLLDFHDLCRQHHGSNFDLGHPHKVELLWATLDGRARVQMAPHHVMGINADSWDAKKWKHTGTYKSGKTLYRAFMARLEAFDTVSRWTSCVALYRRSGIGGLGEIGKELKWDFESVPSLKLRTDDRNIPNARRTNYAFAVAAKHLKGGKATCPHCAGTKWEESIAGWECLGCQKTWSDWPHAEGWV